MSPQIKDYVQFSEADLDAFLALFATNDDDHLIVGDLYNPCHELGLEAAYEPVRELVSGVKGKGNPIGKAELRAFLLAPARTDAQELTELFSHFDYDQRGVIDKHRLKVCAQDLLADPLSDEEAERMIALLGGEREGVNLAKLIALKEMKWGL